MIKEPGIYPDIDFKEYLEIEAVSNSYLSRLADCPAKAKLPRDDTPALSFGRAVHTMVLEGMDAFIERYVKSPNVDKRTKAGKEAWGKFQYMNSDKEIIKSDDLVKVIDLQKAVIAHPFAKKLLAEGVKEQTLIWQDRETKLTCKGRPDFVPGEGKATLIDLKTTRDAGEQAFTRAIANYSYAKQGAFYIDGYGKATGVFIDAFIIIAVESEPPYRTECYLLDDEWITWGRAEYKRLLRIEKECREKGFYPAYQNEGLTQIYKPNWL